MKKWKAMMVAGCMAVVLAACSGGSGAASQSSSSAAAQESTQEAAAADSAQSAESTETGDSAAAAFETVTPGKLTMSTNAAFPPYEMTEDDGSFSGIDVEIAQAIAAELGLELQIDDMDFDAALLAVQQGKSDMVMAGVTVNEERMQVMDFSDSYSTGVQVIIVPEGSDIASVEDLAGHTIGTQRGTTGNIYCTDEFGEDHVVAYDNGLTATQALVNGQIDCIVIDSAPAAEFVKANPGLTILDTEYAVEDYAIGLNKDNPALKDAVNAALNKLIADGTVQSIVDKYINAE